MKRKSIYVLESIDFCYNIINGNNHIILDDEFSVKIRRSIIGCFDSVSMAESIMQSLIRVREKFNAQYEDNDRYVGFLLTELYLNDALYGEDGQYSSFESIRSYLPNGELNYFSDTDERCIKKYAGSDFPDKHVKAGDYAFLLTYDKMRPILIEKVPFTKQEWRENFEKNVYGDFFDDSGLAYTTVPGHIHPLWSHVFPLSCIAGFELPDECKNRITEFKKMEC